MALEYLWQRGRTRLQGGILLFGSADSNERGNRKPEPLESEFSSIAANHPGLLQPSHALGNSGPSEAHLSTELGEGEPRILLERSEDLPSDRIERALDTPPHQASIR
jgi:hypothetical protein